MTTVTIVKSSKKATAKKELKQLTEARSNWESLSTDERSDVLIEAYLKGKQIGKKEMKAKLKQKFIQNISVAQTAGEEMFHSLNDKGVNCRKVYLMIEYLDCYTLLFIVDKGSYLSDQFSIAYKLSRATREKANKKKVSLSILYMPEVEGMNLKKIVSDGYFRSYNGKNPKQRSRSAQ